MSWLSASKIMVVEDDDATREFLADHLVADSYGVVTAASGRQAPDPENGEGPAGTGPSPGRGVRPCRYGPNEFTLSPESIGVFFPP